MHLHKIMILIIMIILINSNTIGGIVDGVRRVISVHRTRMAAQPQP